MLELPHTSGCCVCGPANPLGLGLSLFVDPVSGVVSVHFIAKQSHIGFDGVPHGGVLATVLDEAMVWAASWSGKRFCVCGEMSVRYKAIAPIGQPLTCTARVQTRRAKLIVTTGKIHGADNRLIATASGKYIPVAEDRHEGFVKTFVHSPATARAADAMRGIESDD